MIIHRTIRKISATLKITSPRYQLCHLRLRNILNRLPDHIISGTKIAMIFNRGLKPSRSLISTQLEPKGSWPSLLNGLVAEIHDTKMPVIRAVATKAPSSSKTKALVKLKKYRQDSSVDRRKHSFKRFEPCYRQLYPCRRMKTSRSRSVSKKLNESNDGQQMSDFQRSQSLPNFQWPPLYKCKRRIQESRSGLNLDGNANRELPSWLLPLYSCKAKRAELIERNYPSLYSGAALHKNMEIKESMRQIKLKQISLNQEINEKWSTYYDSPGKKLRNKRDYSSARVLMAVDELKRRIGKMQDRNKTFKPAPYLQTSAQTAKRVMDENRTSSDSPLGEAHNSSQYEVEEKTKVAKQSADQNSITQASRKLPSNVEDSSSHDCTSCSQKPIALNYNSIKSNKDDERHAKEINDNSVLDNREPKKFIQKNRHDLKDGDPLKEENKADSSLDPTKLKERIRQWKIEKDKGKMSDPAENPAGTNRVNGSTNRGETILKKQSVGIEEDPLLTYKPFIVCKTANKVGKRSLSSLPTFRVIPHKASSKGPFVVIKRNFSGSPRYFGSKGSWFEAIKLHRRVDDSNTAAEEAAMVENEKLKDPQKVSENPSKVSLENKPESPANEVPEPEGLSAAGFQKKFSLDIEKKLKIAKAAVNNKPWPKDSKISGFKEQPLQSFNPLPLVINDQQEQISGYQWVSANKEILDGIKQEKQLNYRPLVPEHVKASISEFKIPLKAQIADYRKRNDAKKVGSTYNKSISHRRYTTGRTRALFSTNFPPKFEMLSINTVFPMNTRFLNTSTITNVPTANSDLSNRSKSDTEIVISSDLYKQYVLRPIYGSHSKDKRAEKHPCEFSSWAATTPSNNRQRRTSPLVPSSFPYKFSDVPPRSLKKQVEELKCLIKKNKMSSNAAKVTSLSTLSQHNENYQQRLTRLIRAAEETAKKMEIPEPRRTPCPRTEVISTCSLHSANDGPSALQQGGFDEGSSTAISAKQTVPPRKQPFFNLVLKLKSVVDFVGGNLLPTKASVKQPLENEKTEGNSHSPLLADNFKMSGVSHSFKLNANTRIPSGPTKEEIASLQKTLSELNTSGIKPHNDSKESVQRSTSSEQICEKSNDLKVTNHPNVVKSMSMPEIKAPLSGRTPEAVHLPSTPNESVQTITTAGSMKSAPTSAANACSATNLSCSDNLKTDLSKGQAAVPTDVIKKPTNCQSIDNPYRQTSPSKPKTPSLPIANAFESKMKGPNNSLPSPKSIAGNHALSYLIDRPLPDENSSQMLLSTENSANAIEENSMKPKVAMKQTQEVSITSPSAPKTLEDSSPGHEDTTSGSNKTQSEGNTPSQTQTNNPVPQAASSSKNSGDSILKQDGESMHPPIQPQETMKKISLPHNSQQEPLTGLGVGNNNFGYVQGNLTQEQISSVPEDRYFLGEAQYKSCPDCGRIYPVYCACRTFQVATSAPVESAEPDRPSFLSRYFPDEREMHQRCNTENNTYQQFSEQNSQKYFTSKAGIDWSSKMYEQFENHSFEGATYVRQSEGYSEILDKEPFINPDAIKKLKLPVNFDEELKETTWYNATDIFPRL